VGDEVVELDERRMVREARPLSPVVPLEMVRDVVGQEAGAVDLERACHAAVIVHELTTRREGADFAGGRNDADVAGHGQWERMAPPDRLGRSLGVAVSALEKSQTRGIQARRRRVAVAAGRLLSAREQRQRSGRPREEL
jgi:hypothetical protein